MQDLTRWRRQRYVLAATIVLSTYAASAAIAAGPVSMVNDKATAAASNYWTPERLRNAKPMPLPGVAGEGAPIVRLADPIGSPQSSPPGRGTGKGSATVKLHDPSPVTSPDPGIGPAAGNPDGQVFTHSRVFPTGTLRGTYPWQTVGKLFFTTDTGGDFVCSAAVNQRRVIATAGHCVYNPVTRKFFGNFRFVPGYDNGLSPCGGYGWTFAVTTPSWASGGGRLPNAADFAILVASDQSCRGQTRIGLSLGWLGWRTGSLLNNHVTMLGYPVNLDSGMIMQQTDAQVTRSASPNSGQAGSYMEGGASGGPWVEDFGVNSSGQPRPNSLTIVGITSYQPTDRSRDYLGSSILNSEWVQIWNIACGQPGACS